MIDDSYTLYSFPNNKLGVLAKLEIKTNKFKFNESEMKISFGLKLSQEELNKIEMFQIIISKLLTSKGNAVEEIQDHLCFKYYAVPVIPTTGFNYKVDLDYIDGIINFKLDLNHGSTDDCLLWSNRECKFVEKVDEFNGSLLDKVQDHLYDERILEDLESGLIKPTDTLKSYFEEKYFIKLDGSCKTSLFMGIYEAADLYVTIRRQLQDFKVQRPKSDAIDNYYGGKPVIMPLSIYTYTTIPKSIVHDFGTFYVYFSYMLMLVNAHEFEEHFNLGLNYSVIAEQLVFTRINDIDNLQESSLGNTLIKTLSTIFLAFKHLKEYVDQNTAEWPGTIINDIVMEKSKFTSNNKLAENVTSAKMDKYIIFKSYFDLFYLPKIQDKSIFKLESMKELAKDNVLLLEDKKWKNPFYINFYSHKNFSKLYGNVYEALSSQIYLHYGLKATMDFFLSTSLFGVDAKSIKWVEDSKITKLFPFENYFLTEVKYCNILKGHEISNIEKILNYTFKHKALIERTFIHFSMSEGKFSTPTITDLQELIGDAILDLCIKDYLYNVLNITSHSSLENKKTALVTNANLGRILKATGLLDFYKADSTINFPTKHYGDILESTLGAVFIDMNLNYPLFEIWFNQQFRGYCFEIYKK